MRLAQEEALREYQYLVEKTTQIQKEYSVREKEINNTISSLNNSNARLSEAINRYTTNPDSGSNSSGKESDTSSERLRVTSGLLEACTAEYIYMGTEADKLNNSVNTLIEWGNLVIESNKTKTEEGR